MEQMPYLERTLIYYLDNDVYIMCLASASHFDDCDNRGLLQSPHQTGLYIRMAAS
jgi:hypothetical protein